MTLQPFLTTPHAHRGLHGAGRMENTLPAFEAAVDAGVGIELDLQLTHDGELVCFHDTDLSRMFGRKTRVQFSNYQTLRKYTFPGTTDRIPSLHQVLNLVKGRVPLLIEVKPGQRRRKVEALASALARYEGPVALQSFDPQMVKKMARRTGLPSGIIVGKYKDAGIAKPVREGLENFWLHSPTFVPDFWSYDVKRLNFEASRLLRKEAPVLTWKVDSRKKLELARLLSDQVIFEKLSVEAVTGER